MVRASGMVRVRLGAGKRHRRRIVGGVPGSGAVLEASEEGCGEWLT